jgi:hypothetical protein
MISSVNIDDKLLKTIDLLDISKKELCKILISDDPIQKKNKELIYKLNDSLEHYIIDDLSKEIIDDLSKEIIDDINHIKSQLKTINKKTINKKTIITHNTYGLYGLYSFYNNIFDEYESESDIDIDT